MSDSDKHCNTHTHTHTHTHTNRQTRIEVILRMSDYRYPNAPHCWLSTLASSPQETCRVGSQERKPAAQQGDALAPPHRPRWATEAQLPNARWTAPVSCVTFMWAQYSVRTSDHNATADLALCRRFVICDVHCSPPHRAHSVLLCCYGVSMI